MKEIDFYFDFASPYAYFASHQLETLAREHGRDVIWHPVMVWALLRKHELAGPLDSIVKRGYFLADMERSARFYGVEYRTPSKIPLSSHLAARAYYGLAAAEDERARAFGAKIFEAYFRRDLDISNLATLVAIGAEIGISSDDLHRAVTDEAVKKMVFEAIDSASERGVFGSPFIFVDDEPFFGVDRLPQIAWRLQQGGKG